MELNECKQVLQKDIVITAFREKIRYLTDKIYECIFKCFYKKFIKEAEIKYYKYPIDFIRDVSDISFTDGIGKFHERVVGVGLYDSGAGIETILRTYYSFQLLSHITEKKRLDIKNKSLLPDLLYSSDEYVDKGIDIDCLYKCLNQFDPENRQIVVWRHIERLSIEEIAKRLANIRIPATRNRVHRCMKRLRKLMDDCKKNNNDK